jgi:hypothetical protein
MGTATLRATYNGEHTEQTTNTEEVAFDVWSDLVLEALESEHTTVNSLTASVVRDDGETLELVIEFNQPVAEDATAEQEATV